MEERSFAWISPTRAVYLVDRHGKVHDPALPVESMKWGNFNVVTKQSAAFSWPTWSPDGQWLGVFRLPTESASAKVYTIQQGGVRSSEVGDLGDRIPIYLFWSPSGRRLATLCQAGSDLELSCFDTQVLGRKAMLAGGTPLFFTWAGEELLAFVGTNAGDTRLELFDPRTVGRSTILPGTPGNFCSPLWVADRAVYVVHLDGHAWLCSATATDSSVTPIEAVDGLVAMLPCPTGEWIARAIAPDGDGTPYQRLALVSVATGEVRPLCDAPCLAFMWCPTGRALILARVDTDRNLIVWSRVGIDGGAPADFAALYPTRDLGFYLRFFEQYAQSHPLVSGDGRQILLAGGLDSRSEPDRPRIWRVATDGSGAEEIGEGLFAVYAPEGSER
jgi:hypothetical protein